MSLYASLTVLGAGLALILLLGRRFERVMITPPMLCLAFGYGLHAAGFGAELVMREGLITIAEATLSILLFSDAAGLSAKLSGAKLRAEARWPLRLLLIGLPLAALLGTLAFIPLFPDFSWWELALLAALLTPTDAALGQAIFSSKAIPEKLRDSLLMESGLNDGLALPLIVFFACGAAGFSHGLEQSNWLLYALGQIAGGLGLGALIGALGGLALRMARQSAAMDARHSAVFALLLTLLAYSAAPLAGGNSFVAVFVAGLAFGVIARDCGDEAREFMETDGLALSLASFVFIGAVMLPEGLPHLGWGGALAVALSLFVIRPAAIWLALIGSGASAREKLFLGWFGPRGLATALFALFILEEIEALKTAPSLLAVSALAVAVSSVAHGVSAHFAGRMKL